MRLVTRTLAAIAALASAPAAADTLVDNVDGITVNEEGEVVRFTGLVFDDDGVITQVLERGEERPADVEYGIDGQGRVMLPGMIDPFLTG